MSNTKIKFAGSRRAAVLTVPLFALTLGLAACSGGEAPATGTSAAAGKPKVAAVIKGLDNPFFQAMQDGVNATAQTAGVEVSVQAAADIGDTTGQADKLSALAGQDFGCYVVNPISGTNLVQSLAQVSAADKTIINIDNPVDPEQPRPPTSRSAPTSAPTTRRPAARPATSWPPRPAPAPTWPSSAASRAT